MDRVVWTSDHPVDLAASVARYTRWGADPVNVVVDGNYHRVTAGGTAYRASSVSEHEIEVVVAAGNPDSALADLNHRLADRLPRPTSPALRNETVASGFAEMPGYRPPLVADPFESLVTSITAQQVNLRWATTTRRRLVERFGTLHTIDGVSVWAFPPPAVLAGASPQELRDMQFTMRKSEYIVGVAAAAHDGHLEDLRTMSTEAVLTRLTDLHGIGRWSADWLLARCLGRGEIIAAGDLGVRKAVSWFLLGQEELASEADVRRAVAGWGLGTNWATHLLLERLAAT